MLRSRRRPKHLHSEQFNLALVPTWNSVFLAVTLRWEYHPARQNNLEIAALGSGAEGQIADYYYVVEHCWVVRVNTKKMVEAEKWEDGQWVPFHDLYDITMNGRLVAEEEAVEAARYFDEEGKKQQILEERKKRRVQKQM